MLAAIASGWTEGKLGLAQLCKLLKNNSHLATNNELPIMLKIVIFEHFRCMLAFGVTF